MFVVTADQRGSRRHGDLVPAALETLGRMRPGPLRRFERTAGDEIQAVCDDPVVVVDIVLVLMRTSGWRIGVGVGPVETPLPRSGRAGRGPAFVAARTAVRAAHATVAQLAVVPAPQGGSPDAVGDPAAASARGALGASGPVGARSAVGDTGAGGRPQGDSALLHAHLAQAALWLLCRVLRTRSASGWEVVDLLGSGLTQREVAARLHISASAVSQRVRRSGWAEQRQGAPLAAHHLSAADGRTPADGIPAKEQ